jgi:FKBP-type peptidyl-prolyl cis-trans isomerase
MRLSLALVPGLALFLSSPLAAEAGQIVSLPGLQYKILRSGPADGVRPTRSDRVSIRYVGRLADGSVFSTSPDKGAGATSFDVRMVIPGFSALVQLMRPGDRWEFRIPGYLGYGHEGKKTASGDASLRQEIPADATLIFEVELVGVAPAG